MYYSAYRNKYAVGQVERSQRVRYIAYAAEGLDGTGIGIEQRTEGETYAIHSIYVDGFMQGKDTAKKIIEIIDPELDANSYANMSAVNVSKFTDHPFIKIYAHTDGYKFDQAKQLATDALERRSSVSEQLEGEESTQ